MEILFDNPIGSMYGPYFLLFYALTVAVVTIVLVIAKRLYDQTDRLSVPPVPHEIDPFEMAFLRGGTNEVVRAVVFSLLQKGYIEVDNSGSSTLINKIPKPAQYLPLTQIEQTALGWLGSINAPKELFGANSLSEKIKLYCQSYEGRLEQQQLLVSEEMRLGFNAIRWTGISIVGGLAAYKILAAIVNGNFNFIFLVILAVIGVSIAYKISVLPRVTKLGRSYLEKIQDAFDTFKYKAQRNYLRSNYPAQPAQAGMAGVDPLLLSVGIFGSTILAGTVFSSYNDAFQRAQAVNQSGASSSCGTSCGSSCSSSGGDGGSSCGGGCGGCGGGCS